MPNKIIAWQCEYGCGKYLKTKSSIKDHEKFCMWNPENAACISCNHNKQGNEEMSRYCEKVGETLISTEGKINLKRDCGLWVSKFLTQPSR